MADDAQSVSDNAELEDIAKMPIDIELLNLRISRSMRRHGTIGSFIRIIRFIKALSFRVCLKLLDYPVSILGIIFSNKSVEINPKFIWYGNLVKQNEGYVDALTDELIIKVTPYHIEVKREYLKDFLCALDKVCVIVFDHRRHFNSSEKIKSKYEDISGENYFITLSVSSARGFQSADAAPDDRFNSTIVPVEPSKHFTTFSADDDLGEAVIAAIATFLAIGTGFDHSPAD